MQGTQNGYYEDMMVVPRQDSIGVIFQNSCACVVHGRFIESQTQHNKTHKSWAHQLRAPPAQVLALRQTVTGRPGGDAKRHIGRSRLKACAASDYVAFPHMLTGKLVGCALG